MIYRVILIRDFRLSSVLYDHFDQMLHELVETNVLSEVVSISNFLIGLVHLSWIHPCLDPALVRIILMSDEQARVRESVLHDEFGIFNRSLEQLFEILVVRLIVVASLLPLVNRVTFPNAHVEECVE